DEHRNGEQQARCDQRRSPAEAIGDGYGRYFGEDHENEVGRIQQRDLRQGEATLLQQVDDPNRPPELEVHQEAVDVRLPDIAFEGDLVADAREQIHGSEYIDGACELRREATCGVVARCQGVEAQIRGVSGAAWSRRTDAG